MPDYKHLHPKTQALLQRIRDKKVCKACGDSGKNSRGGECYPCAVKRSK